MCLTPWPHNFPPLGGALPHRGRQRKPRFSRESQDCGQMRQPEAPRDLVRQGVGCFGHGLMLRVETGDSTSKYCKEVWVISEKLFEFMGDLPIACRYIDVDQPSKKLRDIHFPSIEFQPMKWKNRSFKKKSTYETRKGWMICEQIALHAASNRRSWRMRGSARIFLGDLMYFAEMDGREAAPTKSIKQVGLPSWM